MSTECEDCGEECRRRTRCKRCGKLVCCHCLHHTHKFAEFLDRTQKRQAASDIQADEPERKADDHG